MRRTISAIREEGVGMRSMLVGLRSPWAWLGTVALLFAAAPLPGYLFSPPGSPAFEFKVQPDTLASGAPIEYRDHALDAAGQVMVHSATLALLPGGNDIRAYWFGGTREGAGDVAIFTARYSADLDAWSPARKAVTRQDVAGHLGRFIRKLGNPVAFLDSSERLWLFFVSVSIGGWAGSAVNYAISDDGGETFGTIQRLATSPFFNISTLVRGSPLAMQDGGMTIPVYHEFAGKFAELIILGPEGRVRDKRRISHGRGALQPVLVPTSPREAVAFMRNAGPMPRRMLRADTLDAGHDFTRPRPTILSNPNSSVAAALLPDQEIMLLYNPYPTGRNTLSLATASASDGWESWTRWHDFEYAPPETRHRFSYPAWLRDQQGRFHAAWTHDRKHIRHVMFNQAWLNDMRQRQERPEPVQ